ncbi:hypothetical protein D3C78_656870 [compost metagenome]
MYKDYLSVRVQQINVKEIKCLCRRVDESSYSVLPNNWIFDYFPFAKNIIDMSAICHFGLTWQMAVSDMGEFTQSDDMQAFVQKGRSERDEHFPTYKNCSIVSLSLLERGLRFRGKPSPTLMNPDQRAFNPFQLRLRLFKLALQTLFLLVVSHQNDAPVHDFYGHLLPGFKPGGA